MNIYMYRIERKPPVDWFRIIADLKRCGLSQVAVARLIGVPRDRLKEWVAGKAPRYDDGRALLMLWRRACLAKSRQNARRSAHHSSMTITAIHRNDIGACGRVAFFYDEKGAPIDRVDAERVTHVDGSKPNPGDSMICSSCGAEIGIQALDLLPGEWDVVAK